ncbi:MAG TPA: response regulator transcription factor [Capsulimonadaceae bacterium]|nr:response regulator transcription factor [Capsulimonadaceae bacterium]
MDKATILVIDDEPEILRAVRAGLTALGYEIRTATSGEDALASAAQSTPDLVVLDVMLPGELSGLDVCRRLREWSDIPILMLSALGQERQKVAALDSGADDYITKPFGMGELTARVRALLRRYRKSTPDSEPASFAVGNLSMDYARRLVLKAGEEVRLTPLEYDILRFLTQNADRVVTHRQLLSRVWGAEYSEDTQLLRVHVGHLRAKIEDNPARPSLIVTEPGVGYRLRTE